MSPTKRRVFRAALYALALAGGVAGAHVTAPRPVKAAVVSAPSRAIVAEAPPRPTPAARTTSEAEVVRLAMQPGPPIPGAPDSFGEAFRDGSIISGSTPHRLILFTFDDGPDRRTTPLLLDRLDAAGVKAVFFLTASRIQGRNVAERQQAAIARDIVARGHIVASHTRDHKQLPLLSDSDALEQLTSAQNIFERVLGERPWLFRPPGGAHSPRIDAMVSRLHYTTMLWNLGAGDFQVRTGEEVYDTWRKVFERRARDYGDRGGIVLLHDTYAWSVDAFQMIIADLEERNCALLQTGEELYDVVDDPTLFFRPRLDAPAHAFAEPASPPADVLRARQERLRASTAERCGARPTL